MASRSITQTEFTKQLAAKLDISKVAAEKVVKAQALVIEEGLKSHGRVIVPGVGTFALKHREAGVRKIFGEEREVEASTRLKITPNRQLKQRMGAK